MHLIFTKASSRTSCVDIMACKGNDGQVGNSSARATGYILCVEKTGLELFYQFRPQDFLKLADDRTGSVRDVCSRLLCKTGHIHSIFIVFFLYFARVNFNLSFRFLKVNRDLTQSTTVTTTRTSPNKRLNEENNGFSRALYTFVHFVAVLSKSTTSNEQLLIFWGNVIHYRGLIFHVSIWNWSPQHS